MIAFKICQTFYKQILATVSQTLSWSHFREQLSKELLGQKPHCALKNVRLEGT